MQDRYLFRAKRIDNGEFVIGNYQRRFDLLGNEEHYIFCSKSHNAWEYAEVDPSTICQCTGVPDKNRNVIWENDVVYMRCNGLSGFGKVIYENGCFWVDDKKRGRRYPFSNHDVKYRVDGNIFDNPELLEQED